MKSVMKKMFAVCAATAAITTMSAMAVSADGITAKPNTSNESVVVNLLAGNDVSEEAAIVIFKKSADADKNVTPTDDMIVYLNQQAAADAKASGFLSGAAVLPKSLEQDATYVVRVGDSTNDKFYEVEFTYGKTAVIKYGDVDGIEGISTNDAATILSYYVGKIKFTDEQIAAADVDGIKGISTNDAATVLSRYLGKIDKFPVED